MRNLNNGIMEILGRTGIRRDGKTKFNKSYTDKRLRRITIAYVLNCRRKEEDEY